MAQTLSANDAGRNDERGIFDKHLALILPARRAAKDAKDAWQKANSVYRAALKTAKDNGVFVDALRDVLKMQDDDIETVNQRIGAVNRYALWLRVPIGYQFGLGVDGRTVATAIEDAEEGGDTAPGYGAPAAPERAADHSLEDIQRNGLLEGKKGEPQDSPYLIGSEEDVTWCKGWFEGHQEYVKTSKARKRGVGKPRGRKAGGKPARDPAPAP